MPHGKHQHRVLLQLVAVQRNIAGLATRVDCSKPATITQRSLPKQMTLDVDECPADFIDAAQCTLGIVDAAVADAQEVCHLARRQFADS